MARKLVSNIILGIIGALALALIIMAIVPKSFSIGVSSKPYQITVYGTSSSSYERFVNSGTTQETYKELSKLYRESFSTSSINALFSKTISNEAVYTYDTSDYLNVIFSKGGIVMEFKFNELQTLKKNGKPYVNEALKNNDKYTNGVLTYGKVWISINDTNGFETITFYFQRLSEVGNPVSSSTSTILKVETLANTHNLYKALQEVRNEHNLT